MKKYNGDILSMGILHMLTDLLCHFYAFCLIPKYYPVNLFELFLLYNFIAFALQCPIGYVVDKADPARFKRVWIGRGMGLILIGYALGAGKVTAVLGLISCALGNAVMHATGSRCVMRKGEGGLAGGGIFIAFGAIGVGLGDYFGLLFDGSWAQCFRALFTVFLTFCLLRRLLKPKDESEGVKASGMTFDKRSLLCLSMCLFAVFVRSYIGFLVPNGFKELISPVAGENGEFLKAMLPGIIGFLGKASGGIMVVLLMRLLKGRDLRKMNYIYGISALLLSALFLTLGAGNPVCSLVGNLLFHSVMPVTLYEVYCCLPGNPGFSLGLTTLMLFAGMLPALMFSPEGNVKTILIVVFNVLAALSLFVALRSYLKNAGEVG